MASHFTTATYSRLTIPPLHPVNLKNLFFFYGERYREQFKSQICAARITKIKATNDGGNSFLDMWKKAVDQERKTAEFERMATNFSGDSEKGGEQGQEESVEDFEKKNAEFLKLLDVPVEERDRVQRLLVIDRAAAAIAATSALVKNNSLPPQKEGSDEVRLQGGGEEMVDQQEVKDSKAFVDIGTPGPSFWAWAPPLDDSNFVEESEIKPATQISPSPLQSSPVLEKERGLDFLTLPFETLMPQDGNNLTLPPLQSLVEVEEKEATSASKENHFETEQEVGVQFSAQAAEAADALSKVKEAYSQGVNPDGSRWWEETGMERRPDGVICKWTLTRGISADKTVEWENKYWEAADEFGYKELGSEKSGRDAAGNVWREYWRESLMEIQGLLHLEKTADKWGKNIQGDEWQEKWWEHYDASCRAEKWAHKWCSIDPTTPVNVGHAHVWHERWGEKYDGQGSSVKYTDKWAERFDGDGWAKWGDKWDENFDQNGHGIKQGETWWEGKYGDRWNRTWGEHHNGSGWLHKYGKSSSGEHWDTHVQQDTWYERFPHYGFHHCFENSPQLRSVKKPSDSGEEFV